MMSQDTNRLAFRYPIILKRVLCIIDPAVFKLFGRKLLLIVNDCWTFAYHFLATNIKCCT